MTYIWKKNYNLFYKKKNYNHLYKNRNYNHLYKNRNHLYRVANEKAARLSSLVYMPLVTAHLKGICTIMC